MDLEPFKPNGFMDRWMQFCKLTLPEVADDQDAIWAMKVCGSLLLNTMFKVHIKKAIPLPASMFVVLVGKPGRRKSGLLSRVRAATTGTWIASYQKATPERLGEFIEANPTGILLWDEFEEVIKRREGYLSTLSNKLNQWYYSQADSHQTKTSGGYTLTDGSYYLSCLFDCTDVQWNRAESGFGGGFERRFLPVHLTKLVSPFEETEYDRRAEELLVEIQQIIEAVKDIRIDIGFTGLKQYESEFKDRLGDTSDFIKACEYFQYIIAAYVIDSIVDFDHIVSYITSGGTPSSDSLMRCHVIQCDIVREYEIMRSKNGSPAPISPISHSPHVTSCDNTITSHQLTSLQRQIIHSIVELPKVESQRMALYISRVEDHRNRGTITMTQRQFLREVIRSRDSSYYKPIITALIEAGYIRKINTRPIRYVLNLEARHYFNCRHFNGRRCTLCFPLENENSIPRGKILADEKLCQVCQDFELVDDS